MCVCVCVYLCNKYAVEGPSAPADLRVTEVTSSSFRVSWSAPATAGGIVVFDTVLDIIR